MSLQEKLLKSYEECSETPSEKKAREEREQRERKREADELEYKKNGDKLYDFIQVLLEENIQEYGIRRKGIFKRRGYVEAKCAISDISDGRGYYQVIRDEGIHRCERMVARLRERMKDEG